MRRIHLRAKWAIVPTLILLSGKGVATELEPLMATELRKECLAYVQFPDSIEGAVCSTYVRAFVEGSPLIVLAVEPSASESFTQRALRTRLGSRNDIEPKYCVDPSLTLNDFVLQLLVQAEDKPVLEGESASELLYRTLNRFHRCEA